MQSYIDLQAAPEAKALEIKEPSRPRLVEEMTTLGMVRTPKLARWFAATLILIFVVSPFLLIWLPWQQSLHGNGRLIAFDPTERQQEMEAPIDGRILKWYVQEGQRVKGPQFSPDGKMLRPGDLMVSIQDPDPELPRRLGQQREAVQERIQAARQRIDSFNKQITALQRSRERALLAARNRLAMAEERLKAAGEAVTVARLQSDLALTNFRMENQLVNEGLTSQLTYITAKQRRDQTLADERRAANTMEASRSEVSAMKADVDKIGNDADASISSAMASKQSAEAELASGNRDLADIETRISRQTTQEVTAPCDGTVYRILANADQGGALVKAGERLAIVTPDILDPNHRTVELFLSGNDAPQLMELWRQRLWDGQESPISVRLQFEGWPALQ
ncbi:MAG: HlyD family secretion protein, partial [Gemmataceae bacterium]